MPFSMLSLLLMAQAGGNPMVGTIVMYVAIFAIFWFVIFRPQQKQRKAHDETIRQLKRGDEVVTAGGIVGEVVHIKQWNPDVPGAEDRITIKSAESRLIVERGRIARLTSTPASAAAGAASSQPGA
jgi:preprotein translocase subunit YajC